MPVKQELQAAFAICAAIIGAGFASGREIVGFFSDMGVASFLGVFAASGGIGILTYAILTLATRTGARSFPELYGALMGQPCQDALQVLHGLMCLMTASAMLSVGAELGGLTFPCIHSRVIGFVLTLSLSIICVYAGMRSLSMLGALLLPFIAAYYLMMAVNGAYEMGCFPEGFLTALPMGFLYASFNAALSGGAVCLCAQSRLSPARVGFLTGMIMCVLLSCADWAMLRAGEAVRRMTLPAVALAARWGVGGYYASIFVMWLAAMTTLIAMLHSMCAQLTTARLSRTGALLVSTAGAAVMSVCGFRTIVSVIYPLLGWISGFALLALLVFLPTEKETEEG